MPFIEAPTTFYLGRRYDPSASRLTDEVVYYDSRDLTTHAVVVGMTGSGKTGLCITLLEEAILDNVPAIIIDPKGDITNLLLTFPDLKPENFQPWINVDDARRAGMDLPAYSADVAHRWHEGLASWGIVPDRLRWLSLAAKYSIYTPGSDAGLPISILASLRAPREGWAGNEEAHRERISGTVTALLALIGLNVKPVQDREHVLLSNIFEFAWQRGIDLTLEDIIIQVQKPPFDKLGVFPLDDYFAEKDRYKLAMLMNSIVAAPSFQSWINGESLDIQNLLYQPNGRPRVSIFYIAHLSEPERMFMVTLLLENMLSWLRTLSGTTSLRALLYIDELFGYFPPYPKNPPTKDPLLRLLKQARAFGVGLILATQNPGDLDYKGLTNAGTWFIGRLQSDNDKKRVTAGLDDLASVDTQLNVQEVSRLVSNINPRVFVMHNVHDDGGPILIHTRWSMNYLAGPLTRQQVSMLMGQQRQQLMSVIAAQRAPAYPASQPVAYAAGATGAMPPTTLPGVSAQSTPPATLPGMTPAASPAPTFATQSSQPVVTTTSNAPAGFSEIQPPLQSSTIQYFLQHRLSAQQALAEWQRRTNITAQSLGASVLAYAPMLLAQAAVRYQDRKSNVFTDRTYTYLVPRLEKSGLIHWEEFRTQSLDTRSLSSSPLAQAIYGDLTPGLTDAKRMAALQRELIDVLYNTARLKLYYNPTLKIYSAENTNQGDFQSQTNQIAREFRDGEIDKVTTQFEQVMDKLEDKLRRKQRELGAEKQELSDRRREETFTAGEAFISLLRGRTTYTLSRTSRARRLSRQTEQDLTESSQVIREIEDEMNRVELEFEAQLKAVNDKWARAAADIQEYTVTAFKKDIHIELFGIGWLPHWYIQINNQPLLIPAY